MGFYMKLTKKFFKENTLPKVNAAEIAQFELVVMTDDNIDNKLSEVAGNEIDDERRSKIAEEKKLIDEAKTPEEYISIMRKHSDPFNRRAICQRVADKGDEVMPEVLRYYYRNLTDSFLETAAMTVYLSDKKYTAELYENYSRIKAPYGQALACLMFQMKKIDDEEKLVDLLYDEFVRFKLRYGGESYYEFPLLALKDIYETSTRK